jgi:putative membrane protein
MMDGWQGGMGAWGWILMTVFWLVLIALIVWVGARLFPTRGERVEELERPEDLLDRRLARGEVDPDTYDSLREKLRVARAERR